MVHVLPRKFGCLRRQATSKHALAIAPSEILSAERAGEIWGENQAGKGCYRDHGRRHQAHVEGRRYTAPKRTRPSSGSVTSQRTDLKSVEADYAARGVEIPKYSYTHYTTKEVKP